MKSSLFKILVFIGIVSAIIYACKEKSKDGEQEETVIKGTATIYVDQTLQPIVEDQVAVFESQYDAKLNLINKPESEIVNDLLSGKTKIAVLSRRLTEAEENYFKQKKDNS